MKAVVQRDLATPMLRVWLFHTTPGRLKASVVRFIDGARRELVDADGATEPSLVLHPDEAEALLRELSGVLPASDATVEHLRDARETRDRLLTMVEGRWSK